MRVTGIVGATEYLKRFQFRPDYCDIDRDVACLIAEGYVEWDMSTEKVHITESGIQYSVGNETEH